MKKPFNFNIPVQYRVHTGVLLVALGFLVAGASAIAYVGNKIKQNITPIEGYKGSASIEIPPEKSRTVEESGGGQSSISENAGSTENGGSFSVSPLPQNGGYSNSGSSSGGSASPGSTDPVFHDNSASISYVNGLRSQAGVPALAQDNALNQNARNYALTLASSCADLAHQDLNKFLGSKLGNGSIISAYAENLASSWGYSDNIAWMLDMLKNSPSHYANMVNSSMEFIGIGIVESGSSACPGRYYMVQHFARN